MREILFRGKCKSYNSWFSGDWIKGCFVSQRKANGECRNVIYCVNDYDVICRPVNPSTIGQYIGLNDKNNKKIFEGDICRFREWDNGEMCWIGYIHFEHCQYVISGGPNKECSSNFYIPLSRISSENIEVIGNIEDNPELLEVKNEQ